MITIIQIVGFHHNLRNIMCTLPFIFWIYIFVSLFFLIYSLCFLFIYSLFYCIILCFIIFILFCFLFSVFYCILQDLCIYFLKPSYTASTYWLLLLCGSVRNIAGYSLLTWLPTFFVKEYCVGSADYGWKVALVVLFGGGLGSFLGGFFSDRLVCCTPSQCTILPSTHSWLVHTPG